MPAGSSVAAGLVALALSSAGALARAEAPPAKGGAAAAREEPPRAAAPSARGAARGAVVVAMDDESGPAARALARAVYRDAALRPALDEAAAQTLVGASPAGDAPAAVKELAEVRRAATGGADAGSAPVARRLLASLGAGVDAALVVAVATTAGRPAARVLRVAGASYAPLELGATVHRPSDGAAATFDWPGAAAALRSLLGAGDAAAPRRGATGATRPLAQSGSPAQDAAGARDATAERSAWSSPWFWGSLAGVAAVGLTVFIFAETGGGESDTLRLQGRLAP
jgi:hypothetical protein